LYAIATTKINSYLSKKSTVEKLITTETENRQDVISWPTLHIAILKLKLDEQAIVALRFFENLTIDRIAEITGFRPDNVRIKIAKAIESMKLADTEKQFENLVRRLDINAVPDAGHKDKLRAKMLVAFDIARRQKNQRVVFYAVSAVILLIVTGLALQYYNKGSSPVMKKLVKHSPISSVVENPPTVTSEEKSRLEKIRQLAAEENIAELLKILDGDDLTARLLAAKYLAELTDSNITDIIKLTNKVEKQAEISQPVVQKIESPKPLLTKTINNISQMMITIGGSVVDEQLMPVENAEVRVRVSWDSGSQFPAVDINGIFKTDVNGNWRCENFPQDACRAEVMVNHPDYIAQEGYKPAILEELKKFSYVTFLEKGIAVTGRVFDWKQRPLQATVFKGADGRESSVICDSNGWFRFENLAPSIEVFTVQCKGAAPQIRQIDIGPNIPPMFFTLEPAGTIRARVIDVNKMPLEGVHIKVSAWHGFGSLNFETTTDANGFFCWTDAPADEVLFDLYKPGYIRINSFAMTSDNDYVITLLADTDE
jgi:hypothetical protein